MKMGNFYLNGKRLIVVPAHKKGDKQNLKNYCPIPLLPVAGKIYERILYNNIYEFFTENNLRSPNQSDFKPGDSCINQLLSITHEIYNCFDDGLDVQGIFLEAFDKLWHKEL